MLDKIAMNCLTQPLYPMLYKNDASSARAWWHVHRSPRLLFGRLTLAYVLGLSASASPGLAQATTAPTAQSPSSGAEEITPAPKENAPEAFSIHGQSTNVTQYHPPFTSPFYGPHSLIPGHRGNETTDATLYAGLRLRDGLEAYVNPEVDQGFGLSNSFGVAGFPSGEAYRVGAADPYIRLTRAFFRYTLGLAARSKRSSPASTSSPIRAGRTT